jgi:DNA-binding CsgD family transcriptional regulator/PAS domain-containing protein
MILAVLDSHFEQLMQQLMQYIHSEDYQQGFRLYAVEDYVRNHGPTIDDFFLNLNRASEDAIRKGFNKLNILLDIHSLHEHLSDVNSPLDLEGELDTFYKSHVAAGICAYPLKALPEHECRRIHDSHTRCFCTEDVLVSQGYTDLGDALHYSQELDEAIKSILFYHFYESGETPLQTVNGFDSSPLPRFLTTVKDIFWVIDNNLTIHYTSPSVQTIYERNPHYFIGKSVQFVFGNAVSEKLEKRIQEKRRKHKPFRVQHGRYAHNRFIASLDTLFTPVFTENGLAGFTAVTRDTTVPPLQLGGEATEETDLIPSSTSRGNRTGKITPREFEIIQLVMKGLQNKQIAETLCVAEITVKKHLSSIYSKLHVKNRLQLVNIFSLQDE